MPDYETRYNSEVTCPHCGYVFSDSWEIDIDNYEEEIDCRKCEKPFLVYRDVTVTYCSRKKEKSE